MASDLMLMLWDSVGETVIMVGLSGFIGSVFGIPLGILLHVTDNGGVHPMPIFNKVLGWIINAVRSTPFIILLEAIIPLTRVIAGTSIGTAAAVVPLTIAVAPFIARLVETSLREVDKGLIEAAQAMGATTLQIVMKVLLPEAMPGIVAGLTISLVSLEGYSAMAGAIGWALHCPPLVLFSLITVGYSANALGGAGGPLAVLIIAIVAAELGKAVSKETKVDILVTPLVTIFVGVGLSMLIAAPIGAAASQVGTLIMWATEQAPLVMGILVSVIVGVALTLPISSAAICAALGLTGLAGGAAVAGCCAQMVGFAVMSYRENGVGGLVSQGLGTSMLQMGNIIKNPRIWIAPTLASAITGPLATCLFHFEMNGAAVSSGMGTCGLVGQIGVYTGWVSDIAAGTKAAITPMDWAAMVLLCFVLPAVLSVVFCEVERKLGWIKEGDLKLN